ncbi:MAG: FHA domain-containing protein [Leptolyngbyaceae cyanobacterium RU_5_1]|nr:FHA domain-containing protein [Leptolyngbyaceae cyanobacterium RU_5_1]
MRLEVSLEQTGLTWTLEPTFSYITGTAHSCDICLPCSDGKSDRQLELSCKDGIWYIKRLNSASSIFVNHQSLETDAVPIKQQTRIKLTQENLVLLATPEVNLTTPIPSQNLLTTSTRLLSGYAYREGIVGGFELLNQLRSDPYTSKIPKSSIDLDQVAIHATQSVLLTLIFSIAVFIIFTIQVLLYLAAGLNLYLQLFLALVAGGLMAFEMIYLRWFLARRFLKKYYNPEFRIKSFEALVSYFRQHIYQTEPAQNIITFGGFKPFVGAGEPIPESSWTIPIERNLLAKTDSKDKNNHLDCVEIPVNEFYQAVDQEVDRLHLPELQRLSQLFIDGFELEADGKLLSHPMTRPSVMSIDDPLWDQKEEEQGSRKRAYRVYQYIDTKRDYVLSHFLRFYNAGEITFVESAAYILTGIDRKRFSLAPTLDDSHLTRLGRTVLVAIVLLPFLYAVASVWHIGFFISNIVSWRTDDNKQRRLAEFREEYNYGIAQTLREFAAEPLNLDPYQGQNKQSRKAAKKGGSSTSSRVSLRKVLTNPILLIILLPLSVILIPLILVLLILNWFLNRYRNLNRDFSINLDYYGTQDVFMYWKAIQKAIFRSTIDLLRQKGIDTSQFERISSRIIDSSTHITVGNIGNISGQLAIGSSISQEISQISNQSTT